MAGHDTKETTHISTVFSRTVPSPLDKWSNISSKSKVTEELPLGIRYVGMLVFVEDEGSFYFFKGGIQDINLTHLNGDLEGIKTFDVLVNTTANQIVEIEHNLEASNINVAFQHDDEYLLNGWKRGKIDGTEKGNYIHFATTSSLTSLRVFIIAKNVDSNNSSNPNLDDTITSIQEKLNTTFSDLDTLEKINTYLNSVVAKTVNGNTTDGEGNIELDIFESSRFNLSLEPTKMDYTYFGEDVYVVLLEIPQPTENGTKHVFPHNLNVDKYLKVLSRVDSYRKGTGRTHLPSEKDLALLTTETPSSSFELYNNTIETYNLEYPSDSYLYVEYIPLLGEEGISVDPIGSADIG